MSPEAIRDNRDEIDQAARAFRGVDVLPRLGARKYASQATSRERQAAIVALSIRDYDAIRDIYFLVRRRLNGRP